MIQRLAILGVGLLGGSVAKAVRAAGLAREVVGIGRDLARLEPAHREGVLDTTTTDPVVGVRDADFIVLAAPVLANTRLLEVVWPVADDAALITDVGSTKADVVAVARRLGAARPLGFVGSHPMAGSEQSGYRVARADLFRGANVIVTPTETTETRAVKGIAQFWEALGARVSTLDPESHDRVVAAISHLPHAVAYALVDAVARFEPDAWPFAARGFKDTTRIAASDPTVWKEIFLANRAALAGSLAAFREALAELERLVAAGDGQALAAALARTKKKREELA